jgi:hypothetical protein
MMSSPLTKPDVNYDEAVLAAVNAAIIAVQRDTGYGSIEVTIHDGRVTQIERREKVRFEQSKLKSSK